MSVVATAPVRCQLLLHVCCIGGVGVRGFAGGGGGTGGPGHVSC